MKYKILLFLLLFMTTLSCKSAKKGVDSKSAHSLTSKIEQFINCYNTKNQGCLLNLYHKDYQSLSPINQPKDIALFIENTLMNLEKNNFEIAVRIKEIEAGEDIGFVTMDWQLKTKGLAKAIDPFANVQRVDIWKKDASDKWCIFRTVIYNEKTF